MLTCCKIIDLDEIPFSEFQENVDGWPHGEHGEVLGANGKE